MKSTPVLTDRFKPWPGIRYKLTSGSQTQELHIGFGYQPCSTKHLHFWPLHLDVEVYVYADDVIYSYQLTISQHS